LDINRGYTQLAVTDFPIHSPQARRLISYQVVGHEEVQAPPRSSPTGTNEFLETQSNFGGQSPAPFTAPPSPALSWRDASSTIGLPTSSNSDIRRAHESTDGLVTLSSPTPPTVPLSRHNAGPKSGLIGISLKTRYRQQDESEHRERLDAFERQYGPNHPATLDTRARLGDILLDQGRFGGAETALKEAVEGSRKTFGDEHQKTLDGMSFKSLRSRQIAWVITDFGIFDSLHISSESIF
jgi:hypothetical protein